MKLGTGATNAPLTTASGYGRTNTKLVMLDSINSVATPMAKGPCTSSMAFFSYVVSILYQFFRNFITYIIFIVIFFVTKDSEWQLAFQILQFLGAIFIGAATNGNNTGTYKVMHFLLAKVAEPETFEETLDFMKPDELVTEGLRRRQAQEEVKSFGDYTLLD